MKKRPDWLDERIRLGEVPPHLADDALARTHEPDFEPAQAELEESNRQILSQLPPDRFAAEVERRRASNARAEAARRRISGPARAAWGSVALAGLAGLFFVLPIHLPTNTTESVTEGRNPPQPRSTGDVLRDAASSPAAVPSPPGPTSVVTATGIPAIAGDAGWRAKGTVGLVVQAQTPSGLVPMTDSGRCAPGTRLWLSVPESLAWAAVYSLDERGPMAQHWPLAGDSAQPLPQGSLPRSWELDDTPGKETFVLVWSDKPFVLHAVRRAILVDRLHPKAGSGLRWDVVQVARTPPGER